VHADLTQLLHAVDNGDHRASAELLPLVYEELRKLAAARMARERADFTLQPTALVHEAWLRLGGDAKASWHNRGHYFAAAAEAMRRILVERARRRLAAKRGGGAEVIELDAVEIAVEVPDITPYRFPGSVLQIPTPGAATSTVWIPKSVKDASWGGIPRSA